MECDLATLTLPVFDGLEGISNKARRVIEQAHAKLTTMAAHDRKRPFEYGRWLAKIRDTLLEEGNTDGWNGYCKTMGITTDRCWELTRTYEIFEPYVDVLHMFPMGVQSKFARSKPLQQFLKEAVDEARTGTEISRFWIEERMGVTEVKEVASRNPVVDDDKEEDEDFDYDEDDEDDTPIERTQGFVDKLMENTIAIGDIKESRKELIRILTEETQVLKKRLVNWCVLNKVHQGRWYIRCENSLDAFLHGLEDWSLEDVIRMGE